MSLMSKLLIVLAVASSLFGATNAEVEAFLKQSIGHNPNVQIEKISTAKRTKVENGWEKLDIAIKLKTAQESRDLQQSFYTNGKFVAQQFFKTASSKHATVEDSELIKFAKESVAKNPNANIKLLASKVANRFKSKELANMEAVQMEFDLEVPHAEGTRVISTVELWFVQKGVIIPEIVDLHSGESLKYSIKGEVKASHYRDDRLLAGSKNAKTKMLVFSDPLCPACHHLLPDLIDYATKNSKDVALYYYYKQVIPASSVVEKATIASQKQGKKGVIEKLYKTPLKPASQDELAVLDAFNKLIGTKFTMKDINTKPVLDELNIDAKAASEMLILSTPTLFINGKYDQGYKDFAALRGKK